MPKIYEGHEPYIFVSYAHADKAVALPIIEALDEAGYRVWYDAGVQPATDYTDYLADHVYGCRCLVPLLSRSSLASRWCEKEVKYADQLGRSILPVYLEDVELPRGLDMLIGRNQALFWHKLATDEEFYARLFKAQEIDPCLTDEGRSRRGVKPRDARTADVAQPTGGLARPRAGRRVTSVDPKAGIAEYSWAELKAIAREIAAAGEGEWLALAKRYNLVGQDGRLAGDTKPLVLADGTESSVRICGFRHDELADGGLAGITFEFADVPLRRRMNPTDTNRGGWVASEMREWLNRDFLALLPPDLRTSIAEARKRTNNRDGVVRKNDTSCVTATTDTLWLLSMPEVYGGLSAQRENVPWSPATYDAEGSQYQLYRDRGVSTESYGPAAKRGVGSWWWLRSPSARDSWYFRSVNNDGVWIFGLANGDLGVSPGFCF